MCLHAFNKLCRMKDALYNFSPQWNPLLYHAIRMRSHLLTSCFLPFNRHSYSGMSRQYKLLSYTQKDQAICNRSLRIDPEVSCILKSHIQLHQCSISTKRNLGSLRRFAASTAQSESVLEEKFDINENQETEGRERKRKTLEKLRNLPQYGGPKVCDYTVLRACVQELKRNFVPSKIDQVPTYTSLSTLQEPFAKLNVF